MHKDNLPIYDLSDRFRNAVHIINRVRLELAMVMQRQELQRLISDSDVRQALDSDQDYKPPHCCADHVKQFQIAFIGHALR